MKRQRLRVLGTSVSLLPCIRERAARDLDLDLEFIVLDGQEAQRRGALEPDSFDIYDQWFHDLDLVWPARSIQPIDLSRIDRWGQVTSLVREPSESGAQSTPGCVPSTRLYVQPDGSLGSYQTMAISMLPTLYNADSFAVVGSRGKPPSRWSALVDPSFRGRSTIQSDAAIGALDFVLALGSAGEASFADVGNLSLAEIDTLVLKLRDQINDGQFMGMWIDDLEAIDLLTRNPPTVGSMWWSGFIEARRRGVDIQLCTPEEGYRGWFGGMALSAAIDPERLDAAYRYLNWWLDGYAGAAVTRNGSYSSNVASLYPHLTPEEINFWYDGSAANIPVRDDEGNLLFEIGERREGGSYEERIARITVWNTVMDEHNYLTRRWADSIRSIAQVS